MSTSVHKWGRKVREGCTEEWDGYGENQSGEKSAPSVSELESQSAEIALST